jgi:hypothetical protein
MNYVKTKSKKKVALMAALLCSMTVAGALGTMGGTVVHAETKCCDNTGAISQPKTVMTETLKKGNNSVTLGSNSGGNSTSVSSVNVSVDEAGTYYICQDGFGSEAQTVLKNWQSGSSVYDVVVQWSECSSSTNKNAKSAAKYGRTVSSMTIDDAPTKKEMSFTKGTSKTFNWNHVQEKVKYTSGSKKVQRTSKAYVYTATVTRTAIKLNKTSASIKVGKTVQLSVKNDTLGGIKWSTSDKSIATVSDGLVTGKKAGKATITATLADGTKLNCKVTVKK